MKFYQKIMIGMKELPKDKVFLRKTFRIGAPIAMQALLNTLLNLVGEIGCQEEQQRDFFCKKKYTIF